MAMNTLASYKDDNYVEALALGLNDNYELIRRFAATQAGKCGDLRLIPALVELVSKTSIGDRVDFQLKMALALFPYNELVEEFKKQNPREYFYNAVADNIAEFAESITSDEKRQILFEILKELV